MRIRRTFINWLRIRLCKNADLRHKYFYDRKENAVLHSTKHLVEIAQKRYLTKEIEDGKIRGGFFGVKKHVYMSEDRRLASLYR